MLNTRQLEKTVKGYSNHRRIQIMELLEQSPELSVEEIAAEASINYKTASEHIRRLTIAGLVLKRYDNTFVRHKLTDLGQVILKFLRTLE